MTRRKGRLHLGAIVVNINSDVGTYLTKNHSFRIGNGLLENMLQLNSNSTSRLCLKGRYTAIIRDTLYAHGLQHKFAP
jgi:hypothetical protein